MHDERKQPSVESEPSDNEKKTTDTYTSLNDLGTDWGLSNRALGRILDQAGYRSYGTPSLKALTEGLAVMRVGKGYGWSPELVGSFLKRSGYKKLAACDRFTQELFLTEPIEFS
jgi:hypothetical protein